MSAAFSIVLLAALLQGGPSTYLLKEGGPVRGQVLGIDGTRVRLQIAFPGGHAVLQRDLSEFTAHSGYRMLAALAPGDNPGARLELARYAVDNGLISVARRELALARRLAKDPRLASDLDAAIAEKGAELLEGLARKAVAAGRFAEARRYVSLVLVRYPTSKVAAKKTELLAMLDDAVKQAAARRQSAKLARVAAKLDKEQSKLLGAVRDHVGSGWRANRKGLLASKSAARAKTYFLRAVRHYEQAARAGARALKKLAGDAEVSAGVADLVQRATAAKIETLLNVASLETVKGSFNQAIAYVNRILAIDSRNRAALDMRARIEIAANQPIWY